MCACVNFFNVFLTFNKKYSAWRWSPESWWIWRNRNYRIAF